MLEILLVRHGQTDWNAKFFVMGRSPIPLNEVGREQAARLAKYLSTRKISALISSPVRRALETAETLSKTIGLEVEKDDRLAEIDYGKWVGKHFDEVAKAEPKLWHDYHRDPKNVVLPGGESIKDVIARISDLLKSVEARFNDGTIALVSHADVLKLIILELLKLDISNVQKISIDNCAAILLRKYEVIGWRLVLFNPMNGFGLDL